MVTMNALQNIPPCHSEPLPVILSEAKNLIVILSEAKNLIQQLNNSK